MKRLKKPSKKMNYCLTDINKKIQRKSNNIKNNTNHNICLNNNNTKISSFNIIKNKMNYEVSHQNN